MGQSLSLGPNLPPGKSDRINKEYQSQLNRHRGSDAETFQPMIRDNSNISSLFKGNHFRYEPINVRLLLN